MLAVRTIRLPFLWVVVWSLAAHTMSILRGIFHGGGCRFGVCAGNPHQLNVSSVLMFAFLDRCGPEGVFLINATNRLRPQTGAWHPASGRRQDRRDKTAQGRVLPSMLHRAVNVVR